jgi:hypothetical protein
MDAIRTLERQALEAHRAGQRWNAAWQEHGAGVCRGEPHSRSRFGRLVRRALALPTSGHDEQRPMPTNRLVAGCPNSLRRKAKSSAGEPVRPALAATPCRPAYAQPSWLAQMPNPMETRRRPASNRTDGSMKSHPSLTRIGPARIHEAGRERPQPERQQLAVYSRYMGQSQLPSRLGLFTPVGRNRARTAKTRPSGLCELQGVLGVLGVVRGDRQRWAGWNGRPWRQVVGPAQHCPSERMPRGRCGTNVGRTGDKLGKIRVAKGRKSGSRTHASLAHRPCGPPTRCNNAVLRGVVQFRQCPFVAPGTGSAGRGPPRPFGAPLDFLEKLRSARD